MTALTKRSLFLNHTASSKLHDRGIPAPRFNNVMAQWQRHEVS